MRDKAYFYKEYKEKENEGLITIVRDKSMYQGFAVEAAIQLLQERKVDFETILKEEETNKTAEEELDEYALDIQQRIERGESIETIRLSLDEKQNPLAMLDKEIESNPEMKEYRDSNWKKWMGGIAFVLALARVILWLIRER